MIEDYFDNAPAVDIHNHDRQDGLSLETVWRTDRWHHCLYASMFSIIETNAFLAFNYFRTCGQKAKHSYFTGKLALQLIRNPWLSTIPASPAQPTSQTASGTGNHALVVLSSKSDRKRVQRKCVVCSHVHHLQQKASWFCAECGENAVLCSPCTGHTC